MPTPHPLPASSAPLICDAAVVGGGAAGFFGAIRLAELQPQLRILILERGSEPLRKVLASGGGRCNVTHAEFDPKVLQRSYPRGGRELLGPLTRFGPAATMQWFEQHGVPLKIEADGRVFPQSDLARSIVDCLQVAAREAGVETHVGCSVHEIEAESEGIRLGVGLGRRILARRVLMAAGGLGRSSHYASLAQLGHRIEAPVPSLFAFHGRPPLPSELAGISLPAARLRIEEEGLQARGAILITHRGLSGPAVLQLSARGARALAGREHRFTLRLAWVELTAEQFDAACRERVRLHGRRRVLGDPLIDVPRRLWEHLAQEAGLSASQVWGELTRPQRQHLQSQCLDFVWPMDGRSPNKEEFVTCGGVALGEVDFRSMESRIVPGLYFAGEILDIDALTGGYNFQAAWTTAWLAGQAMAEGFAPERMLP